MHTILTLAIAAFVAVCALSIGANQTAIGQEQQFNITTSQGGGTADIKVSLNPGEGNVTVITEDNSTTLENVTATPIGGDNETGVIVAPEGTNVTEVNNQTTVITTPEEPCACPPANETGGGETGLPPVTVSPAPGQEVVIENATVSESNETGVIVQGNENATGGEEPAPPVEPQPPAPVPEEPQPPATNETGVQPSGNDAIVIQPAGNESGGGNETGNVTLSAFSSFIPNLDFA